MAEITLRDRVHPASDPRDPPEVLRTLGFWPDCGCGECYAIHCLSAAMAEATALRAQVDAAVPAMRDYARRNPRWKSWDNGEVEGKMQDPNGVNAWIEQIDTASKGQPT